jgi:hypothetical protein
MKQLILAILCLTLFACKKGKKVQPAPEQAVLVSPAANEACAQGTIVSSTISTVTLKWNAAANADLYEVNIKNLLTQVVSKQTTSATQLVVNLNSNTPFSWNVVSKSESSTEIGTSETRKFYNAGQAIAYFAPFPPDNLVPAMRQAVTAVNGKINLSWTADDADSDLSAYDVYLGTTSTNIPLLQANITEKKLDDVTVTANASYYWKVVAKDVKGNTAESTVNMFKVN